MSFSADVKRELGAKRPSDRHTEAAVLGMLLVSRSFSFKKILLQTGSREVADCFCSLIRRVFDIIAEVKCGGNSRPTYSVSIESSADRKKILYHFGYKQNEKITFKEERLKTEGSVGAFIRGVFLAAGSMSDPENEYRIDFSFKEEKTADDFSNLLLSRGIVSKITKRGEKYIVYVKDSNMLEDLLTIMGASNETLNLINVKIYKSMKNVINRKNKCETSNILKSANAAFEQTQAIKKLKDSGRLASLPEELIEAALLRMANSEASLTELCRISGNKLTRSGLNHRLKRIIEISKEVD